MKMLGMYSSMLIVWFVVLNIIRIALLLVSIRRVLKESRSLREVLEIEKINYSKTTAILLIILGTINANELVGLIGLVIAIISLILSIKSKKLAEIDIEMASSKIYLVNKLNIVAVVVNVIRFLFGSML